MASPDGHGAAPVKPAVNANFVDIIAPIVDVIGPEARPSSGLELMLRHARTTWRRMEWRRARIKGLDMRVPKALQTRWVAVRFGGTGRCRPLDVVPV
jgi:hypothetical protein